MEIDSIDEEHLPPTTDDTESDLHKEIAREDEDEQQLSVNLRTNRKSIVPVVEVKPITVSGPFLVRHLFFTYAQLS